VHVVSTILVAAITFIGVSASGASASAVRRRREVA
jgi:hypothetical protein